MNDGARELLDMKLLDEIQEVRWFTMQEALSRAASLFDVEALRALE